MVKEQKWEQVNEHIKRPMKDRPIIIEVEPKAEEIKPTAKPKGKKL